MLLMSRPAAHCWLDEDDVLTQIIQINPVAKDHSADLFCRRLNRAFVPAVGRTNLLLRLSRRDDLVCQRLKQPSEIDLGAPAAHDALQSSPQRRSARRILFRVVSYSRSDIP